MMNEASSGSWKHLALIAACLALVFANSLGNSFHYDDEHSILENPYIRSLANIPRFFVDPGAFSGLPEARMYRPLLLVTYALNYAVGGYEVTGYHLVNLLLHLLDAWLVLALARRLLGDGTGALTAALFFALHPLMSEPVNYISSRSSLLATLFFLLAFGALAGREGRDSDLRSAVCYLGGLLSKAIAFSFPLVGALYLGKMKRWYRWRALLFVLLLSGIYLLGTRAIVGRALLEPVRGYGVHLATQVKAVPFYLAKLLMPVGLSVEPAFRPARGFAEAAVVLAGLLLLSLLWMIWRGEGERGVPAFGIGWLLLTLLPASLVPLNVLVNEHRLYLPLVGAGLALGWLVRSCRSQARLGLAGGLALLAVLCLQRNRVWESEESLWADAVAKGPLMARPHVNLGKAYLEQGRYREAIEASRKGLEIDPSLARAHYNIGTAYMGLGEGELAIAHYQRALEEQPGLVQARLNLGNVYLEQGRYELALETYRQALAQQDHPSIRHNLGSAFLQAGRADSARFYFAGALAGDPEMREAVKGLAKAYRLEGMQARAIEVLRRGLERWSGDRELLLLMGSCHAALGEELQAENAFRRAGLGRLDIGLRLGKQAQRRGDWARARARYGRLLEEGFEEGAIHDGLGEVLLAQGDPGGALREFRRAAELAPERAESFANIGRVYLKRGGGVEAVAALERAVELDPQDGEAFALLGDAYRLTGKRAEGIEAYREAIRLSPARAVFFHNLAYIYELDGITGEAERLYRAALERDPELVESRYNLGFLLLGQERFGEAVDCYRQVLARDPERADAWLNLGSSLLGMGQRDGAVDAYRRFLQFHREEDGLRRQVEEQVEQLLAESVQEDQ